MTFFQTIYNDKTIHVYYVHLTHVANFKWIKNKSNLKLAIKSFDITKRIQSSIII